MKRRFLYSFSLISVMLLPAIAFANESEGSAHMGWRVFDFILFAILIVYFVRKPVVEFFKNRKKQIFEEIENAKKAKEEAEKSLSEAEKLLSKLSSEVEKIIKTYTMMGEKEKQDYEKAAKELEELFKKRIEQEKSMILNKLYKNFINQIVSKAILKTKEQFRLLSEDELRNVNKRFFDCLGVEYEK